VKEQKQTSLSTMDKWQKSLTLFLTAIAIITPAYYFIGYTYNLGLLDAYGMPTDIYELSIEDTYALSFIALSPILEFIMLPFSWSLCRVLITAGILLFVTYGLVKLARSNVTVKKLKKSSPKCIRKLYIYLNWKKNDFIAAFSLLISSSAVLYMMYAFSLLLTLIWILPFYIGYSQGEKFGKSQIVEYQNHGCVYHTDKLWSNCKVLQDESGRILFKGILIGTTDTTVAFFTKQGTIVAPRPKGSYIINTPANL